VGQDALEPLVQGDADTQPGVRCAHCQARAELDAAVVRAGVIQITTVSTYKRVPFSCVEQSKAMATRADGRVGSGAGHSREEAIEHALRDL
jgi:hypothetical protein